MAMSLDGFVAPRARHVRASPARRRTACVIELRADHDAVMVGAGTVRVDDPLLTVRPHRTRRKPYARVVVCETAPMPLSEPRLRSRRPMRRRALPPTIVLAPAGAAPAFAPLERLADVLFVGEPDGAALDLRAALIALRGAGIASVLCEGGPTLGRHGCSPQRLVERIVWLVAPRFLRAAAPSPCWPAPISARLANGWAFDRVERLGDDLMLTARLPHV